MGKRICNTSAVIATAFSRTIRRDRSQNQSG